jgi:transposase
MAKPDWGELQRRFLSDHAATGVSPKDWCEAQGLNYATARRYIKKPTAQTAQKPAQKKLRTAQKEKCAEELVDDDGLTDQRLFVAEYLKDNNATQAAIRAGYSKKTAEQIGISWQSSLRRPLRSSRKHPLCARLAALMKCLSRCGGWQHSTPTNFLSIAAGAAVTAGASVTSINGAMRLSSKRSWLRL